MKQAKPLKILAILLTIFLILIAYNPTITAQITPKKRFYPTKLPQAQIKGNITGFILNLLFLISTYIFTFNLGITYLIIQLIPIFKDIVHNTDPLEHLLLYLLEELTLVPLYLLEAIFGTFTIITFIISIILLTIIIRTDNTTNISQIICSTQNTHLTFNQFIHTTTFKNT